MRLDFADLNKNFFDISKIFARRQLANGKTKFIMQTPRATDALLFFSSTMGICYQEGREPLIVPRGALVYLPKNSHYVWENSPAVKGEEQENLLFEFILNRSDIIRGDKDEISHFIPTDETIHFGDYVNIVTTRHSSLYKQLFDALIAAFDAEHFSAAAVYSAAYKIFDVLSGNCRIERENIKDTSIIETGIKYLEDSSFNAKTIQSIAEECNISIGYYERLFKSFSGMTPLEYRNLHRINRIKMLLHNKNLTLEEIALKVGCCDSGYLCRLFKKNTGMTPKEYRKMYLQQTKK